MTEEPLFLQEAAAFYESVLQDMWANVPVGIELPLKSGGIKCKVLSRGIWNHHAGPDFLNAKIEFDGVVRHGDVEIHVRASDWADHGHTGNPDYGNVILHVIGEENIPGKAAALLPDVPVYLLPENFGGRKYNILPPRSAEGLCASFFRRLSDSEILCFVRDAALERFRKKSDAILNDMIAHGVKDAFLLKLFDIVGVPGNRESFRKLALRLMTYPEHIRTAHFHALLWGESGCLPDPTKIPLAPDAAEIVKDLWNQWWTLRRKNVEPISFQRRSRPLNSVERRIAILSAFVAAFGENPLPDILAVVDDNSPADAWNILQKKLIVHDPFWSAHTSFTSAPLVRPSALIGQSRVIELMVDVVLPSLRACAGLSRHANVAGKIDELFILLPKTQSNRAVKTAAGLCFPGRDMLFQSAAAQQGLLHIYKTWCERLSADCKACPVNQLY